MSSGPWEDVATAMKTRIDGWAALGDVVAVVDKQKEISPLVLAAIEAETGCAVTIRFEGFRVPEENDAGPHTLARYAVRVWGLPVVREDDPTFIHVEDAAAEVARALHHHVVGGDHNFRELYVRDGDLIEDPSFLVYELTVEAHVYLT